MKKSQPIRMCIMCRKREAQSRLYRLQIIDDLLVFFSGSGRSFYLCKECSTNPKKLNGLSKRFGQDSDYVIELIESLDK
jgi:predicted RNA-binding protein YlxR (DUF448 family)